jgi:hypothetical protein
MIAKNITADQLSKVAADIGVDIKIDERKDKILFALKHNSKHYPDDPNRYRHKSISWNSERWTPNVCFHGYWDFIYECFLAVPNAYFESSWYGKIKYTSLEQFQEAAKELAHTSIGAPIMGGYPSLIESCDCHTHDYGLIH